MFHFIFEKCTTEFKTVRFESGSTVLTYRNIYNIAVKQGHLKNFFLLIKKKYFHLPLANENDGLDAIVHLKIRNTKPSDKRGNAGANCSFSVQVASTLDATW